MLTPIEITLLVSLGTFCLLLILIDYICHHNGPLD